MSPRRHLADQDLRQVAEDDALLEALARRGDVPSVPGAGDDVTTLLRALTVDVDTHADRAASRPAAVPSASLLPAGEQRPHPLRVRRSTAVLGLLAAIVAGGTGVAAAVTGNPMAGLEGLQRVIEAATPGRADAPVDVPPTASSGAPSHHPGAPGAVPVPGGTPGGTITFAPAPTAPEGTAGHKPKAPGAVRPTTSPRPAAPLSARPSGSSKADESVTEQQRPRSAEEPETGSKVHSPKPSPPAPRSTPARPARSSSPPAGRGERSGGEQAPALDAGRPDVSSSSHHLVAPVPGPKTSPASPVEPDEEREGGS
jgi:hypothetical protein